MASELSWKLVRGLPKSLEIEGDDGVVCGQLAPFLPGLRFAELKLSSASSTWDCKYTTLYKHYLLDHLL